MALLRDWGAQYEKEHKKVKAISFYHKDTGLLHPMVLTLSTGQDVSRNTPLDYIAIEGHHDANCKRVDLQTRTVIDYVPPQLSRDHEWDNDTKRSALDAAVQTKGHARSTALRQIGVLETKGIRAMREAQLGKSGAQDRLVALEAQIEELRAVL